jgi:hypothetical protein
VKYEILPRPHDCEFMTAPIGSKHCHYEADVRTFANQNRPGANVPYVLVMWKKVED